MYLFKRVSFRKHLFALFVIIFATFNIYKCLQENLSQHAYHYFHYLQKNIKLYESKLSDLNKTDIRQTLSLEDHLVFLGKPKNFSYLETRNVRVHNKTRKLPMWQYFLEHKTPVQEKDEFGEIVEEYYFLVAVLQVRLYSYDKAKWSINELKQWFHYLFMAGVEHILICDHFVTEEEKINKHIARYIYYQLVTYIPWNGIRNPMASQTKCYQKFIRQYKRYHMWHVAIDIDEYPFSPKDNEENFLVRYLQKVPEEISEISMENYLMLGQGDRAENLVIKRITRMTKKPANYLSKPIYRPSCVLSAAVHHNHLKRGLSKGAPNDELKMLHYWGGRDQNWGPDTQKTIDITVEMNLMKQFWAEKLEISLLTFGEFDALSNTTGP